MPPLVLATRSSGKLRELRELFGAAAIPVLDLDDAGVELAPDEEGLEVFETFEGNALAKARYFARRVGGRVVADDSGLEVFALGGLPGVRSKRWSGRSELEGRELDDANNQRLLAAMRGVADRRARYVCVAALIGPGGEHVFHGVTDGVILEQPLGTGGFGYDPYFYSDELRKSFGEATLQEKQTVSHRGRAFRSLISSLR